MLLIIMRSWIELTMQQDLYVLCDMPNGKPLIFGLAPLASSKLHRRSLRAQHQDVVGTKPLKPCYRLFP